MEKWKIAIIATLLLSLLGFGIYQQGQDQARARDLVTAPSDMAPSATPSPLLYVGKTLPAWNFKVWNTKPVPLASLHGKPALIEIFRTGCPHCQEAAPFMAALQTRYGPRGLKIVAIQSPGDLKDLENPENKWPDVQAWLKTKNNNYPVAFDEGSRYFQGTIKKQVLGGDAQKLLYPTIMLTDKAGKVDFAHTGFDTPKGIALAVELEKRFPTADSIEKNAADLSRWLAQNLPELQLDDTLLKAFIDDITQRLKGKQ